MRFVAVVNMEVKGKLILVGAAEEDRQLEVEQSV